MQESENTTKDSKSLLDKMKELVTAKPTVTTEVKIGEEDTATKIEVANPELVEQLKAQNLALAEKLEAMEKAQAKEKADEEARAKLKKEQSMKANNEEAFLTKLYSGIPEYKSEDTVTQGIRDQIAVAVAQSLQNDKAFTEKPLDEQWTLTREEVKKRFIALAEPAPASSSSGSAGLLNGSSGLGVPKTADEIMAIRLESMQ